MHYIAMSGSYGCIPDHCEVFETLTDAVEDLVQLFELGKDRAIRLRDNRHIQLELSPVERNQGRHFGAEYCEIHTCACDTPEIHSDTLS